MQRARFVDEPPELLNAAAAVLADGGVRGFTLDRVATVAEISRATLWRRGVTVERLLDGLLQRLSEDYRATMWPVLTANASAAQRLERVLSALCEIADRHLPILQADDQLFHLADGRNPGAFVEPLERLLRDGAVDGSTDPDQDPEELAMTLFNTVVWSFVHLRSRHGWTARRAAENVTRLALHGASRPG